MSKVIPKEELEDLERWQVPEVGRPPAKGARAARESPRAGLMTASQLEALQKQAYEEGFQRGLKDGLDAGQEEAQALLFRLEQILRTLARPLEELDERVEKELVTLATHIARQLIRRELKTDPGEIVGVAREALATLPLSARNVRLLLHPEDAALVRKALAVNEGEQGWRIVEDASLTRGGCRVLTETSELDATVEKRIAAAIAKVWGGERGSDGA